MSRRNRKPRGTAASIKVQVTKNTSNQSRSRRRPRKAKKPVNSMRAALAFEERAEIKDYMNMLARPFECQKLQRGPGSGQPTGLFTCNLQFDVIAAAGHPGWAGVIATPYINAMALRWQPAAIAGAVGAGDFVALPATNTTAVANSFTSWRPLAGAVRLVNSTSVFNAAGTIHVGTFSPGQQVVNVNYSNIPSYQNFSIVGVNTPAEALFLPTSGTAQQGAEYRNLASAVVGTVLNDAFFGFPAIYVTGLDVAKAYTLSFQVRWIMEGLPSGNQSGVVELGRSVMTYDDWQRICNILPIVTGPNLARVGESALEDTDSKEDATWYIPSFANLVGTAAAVGAAGSTYWANSNPSRNGLPRYAPNL